MPPITNLIKITCKNGIVYYVEALECDGGALKFREAMPESEAPPGTVSVETNLPIYRVASMEPAQMHGYVTR